MSSFRARDCELFVTDEGTGRPVVFIHGWTVTSRFFDRQRDFFAGHYRFVAPDLRSHGRSERVLHGNTVPAQTRDLHELFTAWDLRGIVLVGWSSGAFNVWEYLRRYGDDRVAGIVIVDESPCPLKRPDWEHGYFDLPRLVGLLEMVQTNFADFVRNQFLGRLFAAPPDQVDAGWMSEEITMIPPSIAAVAAFDEHTRDYRAVLPEVKVPALVCFGRHDAVVPQANSDYVATSMPDARLVMFEDSGHSPFWEEPARFNAELDRFIRTSARK